jgi:succinyl-CoA synthetase alpha subunit
MSILVDENTKVIVQGITGAEGRFHAERMIEYGTRVVAGVTPGKGGRDVLGVPVFDTMEDAVAATGANASVIFVPPAGAADAVMESAANGLPLVVCITEGIPVLDMVGSGIACKGGTPCSSAPTAPASFRPARPSWASCPAPSTARGPSAWCPAAAP